MKGGSHLLPAPDSGDVVLARLAKKNKPRSLKRFLALQTLFLFGGRPFFCFDIGVVPISRP